MSQTTNYWSLILGGSSGMGLATAHKLADEGHRLILVHRDRRGAMKTIQPEFDAIAAKAPALLTLNQNALTTDGRTEILAALADQMGDEPIGLILHSIALGNLRSVVPKKDDEKFSPLGEEDFSQTIANMGFNLLLWVQDLYQRSMLASDTRVIGLTSEGNTKAWDGYAAVSAAKCALESVARTIAKEFGPHGVRCNIIQAGVCNTPALRLIPGHDEMLSSAVQRNPLGRLTAASDVANAIYLLSRPEAAWINGALLHVDGGEHLA